MTQVAAGPRGTYVAGDPSLVAPSPGARGEKRLRAAMFFECARAGVRRRERLWVQLRPLAPRVGRHLPSADGPHTDGWVQVQLGQNGCATELRMEDPDPPFVACMAEQLRAHQCNCQDVASRVHLGLGHDGCAACGTGELRCPPGSTCQDGKCVEDDSGAGGSSR